MPRNPCRGHGKCVGRWQEECENGGEKCDRNAEARALRVGPSREIVIVLFLPSCPMNEQIGCFAMPLKALFENLPLRFSAWKQVSSPPWRRLERVSPRAGSPSGRLSSSTAGWSGAATIAASSRAPQSSMARWTPWRTPAGFRPALTGGRPSTRRSRRVPCAPAPSSSTRSRGSWSGRTGPSLGRRTSSGPTASRWWCSTTPSASG